MEFAHSERSDDAKPEGYEVGHFSAGWGGRGLVKNANDLQSTVLDVPVRITKRLPCGE
jgi:hypothetical protein